MPLSPTVAGDLRRLGWHTVVCICAGPSLTREQCNEVAEARRADRCRVIAVNDAAGPEWAPFADVMYACDAKFFRHYATKFEAFPGERWSQTQGNDAGFPFPVNIVRGSYEPGLSKEPATVTLAGNSGYQASGLAHLFGSRRQLLLGYDCNAPNGKRHAFGSHPPALGEAHTYRKWIEAFDVLAIDLQRAGVDVVNCSPGTAIRSFRRADKLSAELWR